MQIEVGDRVKVRSTEQIGDVLATSEDEAGTRKLYVLLDDSEDLDAEYFYSDELIRW